MFRENRRRTAFDTAETTLGISNAGDLALDWSYQTGLQVGSSPSVVNGVSYFGSNDGKLYALVAAKGSLLWSFPTGGVIFSSPAVVNGVVYFGSADKHVY